MFLGGQVILVCHAKPTPTPAPAPEPALQVTAPLDHGKAGSSGLQPKIKDDPDES